MKNYIFSLLFMLFSLCVNAQYLPDSVTFSKFYFPSSVYQPSREQLAQIKEIFNGLLIELDANDRLKNEPYIKLAAIHVTGFSDHTGPKALNKRLSLKRARFIASAINDIVKDSTKFIVKGLGAEHKDTIYKSEDGKARNRRVEVRIAFVKLPSPKFDSIAQFIGVPVQDYCIDPVEGGSIRLNQGTIIRIPPNAFKLPYPNLECVTLKAKEVFSKSEMIREDLSTTSNGIPLISDGMLQVEAYYDGKRVNLAPGKELTVMMPRQQQIPKFRIYDGERLVNDSANFINWKDDDLNAVERADFELRSFWNCDKSWLHFCASAYGRRQPGCCFIPTLSFVYFLARNRKSISNPDPNPSPTENENLDTESQMATNEAPKNSGFELDKISPEKRIEIFNSLSDDCNEFKDLLNELGLNKYSELRKVLLEPIAKELGYRSL